MITKRLRLIFGLGLPLFLSACFVGDAPLIPEGQAAVIGSDKIDFCTERECFSGVPLSDGYEVTDPGEPSDRDTMVLRFEPLWADKAGIQVFVAELSSEGEDGLMYFFARQKPDEPLRIDLRAPECSQYDDAARKQFNLIKVHSSCTAPTLESLKAALLHVYADDFAQPDFWREER